eukprot:121352_1
MSSSDVPWTALPHTFLVCLAVITQFSAAPGAALRHQKCPDEGRRSKISLATRTAPTIQTRRRTIPPTIINTIRQESPSRLDGTRFLSKGARGRQKRKQDGVLVATKGGTGQRVLRAPTSDGRDGNRDPRQRRSSASTTTIPNMGVSGWVHSDMTLPPPKTSNLNSMPESPHRMALRDDH